MVTRDDVARRAGTSTAVVSYVVNDGPRRVSAPTRARVLRAIEELGYRPNGFARALRSTRSRLLGLVVPDNSNPFFAELARVIEDEAFSRGYLLLLGNSTEDDQREAAYVREFLELRVEGLLLISSSDVPRTATDTPTMQALRGARTCTVILDRAITGIDAAFLSVDNAGGGYMATRHLLEHGHRKVTCLAGPSGNLPAEARTRGWRRAMREAGRTLDRSMLLRSRFRREDGHRVMRALLATAVPPSAVFAESDEQAIGVLRAAAECGLRVPGDLAVVSFDGIPESRFTQPALTTVAQPFEELGRRAVEMAVAGPHAGPRRIRLPVALELGGSCGCKAGPGIAGSKASKRRRAVYISDEDPASRKERIR